MASLGVLGLATRIVDDLEILMCLCRVLYRSSPRPSRRRVVRALFRTIAHDRLLHRGKPRGRTITRRSDDSRTKRSTAALLSRALFVGVADEELFASSTSPPPPPPPHSSPPPKDAAFFGGWKTRVFDEVALYSSWRYVARRVVVDPRPTSGGSTAGAFGAWLLARLAVSGGADVVGALPWPFLVFSRGLVAHPFECAAVAPFSVAEPSPLPESSLALRFWGSWRGGVLALFLDRYGGLGSAPRLLGLVRHRDPRLRDGLLHARASLERLPAAVAAVVLARLAAFFLFGSSTRRAHLERRLAAYLGSSRHHHHHHAPRHLKE